MNGWTWYENSSAIFLCFCAFDYYAQSTYIISSSDRDEKFRMSFRPLKELAKAWTHHRLN
jgi:hypothetical protein